MKERSRKVVETYIDKSGKGKEQFRLKLAELIAKKMADEKEARTA